MEGVENQSIRIALIKMKQKFFKTKSRIGL